MELGAERRSPRAELRSNRNYGGNYLYFERPIEFRKCVTERRVT